MGKKDTNIFDVRVRKTAGGDEWTYNCEVSDTQKLRMSETADRLTKADVDNCTDSTFVVNIFGKDVKIVCDNYYKESIEKDARLWKYDLWISRYAKKDILKRNNKAQKRPENTDEWVFWQMTDTGYVSGIPRTVDIDRFQGTYKDFVRKFVQQK